MSDRRLGRRSPRARGRIAIPILATLGSGLAIGGGLAALLGTRPAMPVATVRAVEPRAPELSPTAPTTRQPRHVELVRRDAAAYDAVWSTPRFRSAPPRTTSRPSSGFNVIQPHYETPAYRPPRYTAPPEIRTEVVYLEGPTLQNEPIDHPLVSASGHPIRRRALRPGRGYRPVVEHHRARRRAHRPDVTHHGRGSKAARPQHRSEQPRQRSPRSRARLQRRLPDTPPELESHE